MLSGKEVLEKVLEHLGLTPAAFANKIGLSRPQAIYDIQKGKTSSVSSMVDKIKRATGASNKLRQELEEIKKMLPGCK